MARERAVLFATPAMEIAATAGGSNFFCRGGFGSPPALTIRPMDQIILIKALILGVVEGLTEFLPVSSTGHLILVGDLLDFNDEKGKIFEIVIQTGAMFAIIWEYRAKFAGVIAGLTCDRDAQRFVANLAIAFLPAAILGLAFGSHIKAALFKPVPVALAFIVGAFVILWAERHEHRITV